MKEIIKKADLKIGCYQNGLIFKKKISYLLTEKHSVKKARHFKCHAFELFFSEQVWDIFPLNSNHFDSILFLEYLPL